MIFEPKRSALIVGCGRLGGHIAEYLAEQGVRVTILDENPEAFRRLSESFGGQLLQGNGMSENQLRRAHIEQADLFIAATGNDSRNNLLAQIACRIYNVPHVFARFDDANIGKLVEDLPIRAIFPFTLSLAEFEKDYDFLFGEED
ncbi:MAG: TrkA family potassium uptake protein [Clostridia bacterium]|nr:TrkA family potassium uptake protein [Clostridia bacterium]MBP5272038.1 TrkA family potassium uptake protein [Clostridia bacterium]